MTWELREVVWRGRTQHVVFERAADVLSWESIVADEFADLDPLAPGDLVIAGVPCRRFAIVEDGRGGAVLHAEPSGPLPPIVFVPHQEFPPRAGDLSYEDARARVGDDVNVAEIRETADYWLFPHLRGIGSVATLVEKAGGKVVPFGSAFGLDGWLWGYERGFLDDPPRDLVITKLRDPDAARRALTRFVKIRGGIPVPLHLPGAAHWLAIQPLREAGDALEWHVRPAGDSNDRAR